MAAAGARKFVLDTNCFVDASRTATDAHAFAEFCARTAPGLYLSAVVAAELRAGAGNARDRRTLEREVLAPYIRRGRILTPSAAAWEALGTTLAALVEDDGLVLLRPWLRSPKRSGRGRTDPGGVVNCGRARSAALS
jgi:predicted nucleic acid-binding protein